jgi:hypothetical protein
MTATLPAPSRPSRLESDFIALICADTELLRAEFEEIVAAGWQSGPPARPTPERGRHRGPDSAEHRAEIGDGQPAPAPPGHGCHEQARQRSPPRRWPPTAVPTSSHPITAARRTC